jgi:hypothetical protein
VKELHGAIQRSTGYVVKDETLRVPYTLSVSMS